MSDHMERDCIKNSFRWAEKVFARQISTYPLNTMNQIHRMPPSSHLKECSEVVRFDVEQKDRRDKEMIEAVIGVPWRLADRR